jgi:hypothetical protein
VGLAVVLAALGAWLVGPWAPWWLPGDVTLVPGAGQSRLHTLLAASGWAAVANALVATGLFATARVWTRATPAPGVGGVSDRAARGCVLVLAAGLAVRCGCR